MKTAVVGELAAIKPRGERLADGVDDLVHLLLLDVRDRHNLDELVVQRAVVRRRLLLRQRSVEACEDCLAEALEVQGLPN